MSKKKLSPAAELAAHLIRGHKDDEVEAPYLENQMGKQRWEIVALLKELDGAGLGRFIPGRRGYETRFAKAALPETTSLPMLSASTPEGEHHVLILKRETPFRISVPVDITRLEADRIARWVNALPDD